LGLQELGKDAGTGREEPPPVVKNELRILYAAGTPVAEIIGILDAVIII